MSMTDRERASRNLNPYAEARPTKEEVKEAWRVIKAAYFPDAKDSAYNIAPVHDALSAAAKVRASREGDSEDFTFTLQPMGSAPTGEDAMEPSEIDVHEGAWAIVLGTNAKPIGWIDTHALFVDRTYRNRAALANGGEG